MKLLKTVAAISLLTAAGLASAHCALKDAARDTGWELKFDETKVSCAFTGNAGTGRNKGTLNLTVNVNDGKPVDVQFVQVNRALANSFGMRITMNITINNNFAAFKELRGKAVDRNEELEDDINEFVSDAHPGEAHFHNDPSFSGGPFRNAVDCKCEADDSFKIKSDGLLFGFGVGTVKGIGVHQIEQRGTNRSFTLRLTPKL